MAQSLAAFDAQARAATVPPPALRCVIHAEHSIDVLAAARPAFSVLDAYLPCKSKATAWSRSNGDSYDLTVVAMGKTGYGKSTTLNTLLGESAFETSDVGGCTRKLQSVEYRFRSSGAQYFCSFADLPGLGETSDLDAQYYPLYQATLRAAQVVLYFVRADQRDYSVDQRAFAELVHAAGAVGKVILVVNAIDKIEPLNRSLPFQPSAEQKRALDEKMAVLRGMFSLPESALIPVAGAENYNLDRLASAIMSKLSASLVQA